MEREVEIARKRGVIVSADTRQPKLPPHKNCPA